ncbi:UDP-N-acetylenolpyruvoylglucosamine reductase [Clostridia bacterium]|nr:UDP-N-acetylenolpyruvoylglucosamine reductase [Clostridia bacterium]
MNMQLSEICNKYSAECLQNERLAPYTTFGIGGGCDYLVKARTVDKRTKFLFADILRYCRQTSTPLYILGKGSNLLISDSGVCGVVLLMSGYCGINYEGDTFTCQSGASLSDIARAAQALGRGGLEFAQGIPGTIGGAVYMNAGAYGSEVGEFVSSVCSIDVDGGGYDIIRRDVSLLNFGYRSSVFSQRNELVTEVVLKLPEKNREDIQRDTLELIKRRAAAQPLEYKSAGSVFKRPASGYAAKFIDSCGLKGQRVGGAVVSEKHAGFIVNTGNATSGDVLKLIGIIHDKVFTECGVDLKTEIKMWGTEKSVSSHTPQAG